MGFLHGGGGREPEGSPDEDDGDGGWFAVGDGEEGGGGAVVDEFYAEDLGGGEGGGDFDGEGVGGGLGGRLHIFVGCLELGFSSSLSPSSFLEGRWSVRLARMRRGPGGRRIRSVREPW